MKHFAAFTWSAANCAPWMALPSVAYALCASMLVPLAQKGSPGLQSESDLGP